MISSSAPPLNTVAYVLIGLIVLLIIILLIILISVIFRRKNRED